MRGREEAERQGEKQSFGGQRLPYSSTFLFTVTVMPDSNNLKLEGRGSQSTVQRGRTEWRKQLTVGQQEDGEVATWCRKPGRRDRTRNRPG